MKYNLPWKVTLIAFFCSFITPLVSIYVTIFIFRDSNHFISMLSFTLIFEISWIVNYCDISYFLHSFQICKFYFKKRKDSMSKLRFNLEIRMISHNLIIWHYGRNKYDYVSEAYAKNLTCIDLMKMQKYVELDQVHRMNGIFSVTRTRNTLLELERIELRQLDFGRLQGEIKQYILATPKELGWGKLLYFTQDVPLMAKKLIGSCMNIDSMTTMLK